MFRKWKEVSMDNLFVFNIYPLRAVIWHATEEVSFFKVEWQFLLFFNHTGNTPNGHKVLTE